ncbi:unnamed protein product [Prunus armeniaca]
MMMKEEVQLAQEDNEFKRMHVVPHPCQKKKGKECIKLWDSFNTFWSQTALSQEELDNDPYIIGKMLKSSFCSILRFMVPSLVEEVMQVLAA